MLERTMAEYLRVERKHLPRLAALLISWALAALMAHAAMAESIELRVMSFNVRRARTGFEEKESENNWKDAKFPRRERAIRVVRENSPDLIGVQEARDMQIADFREALRDYEFYGVGRDDGKTAGEYSGIFYLKGRFTRKDAGSFWLSETPEKPGTTFYHALMAPPRIASWVRLRENKSGREFIFLNMHWDNASESARQKSAALVRERVAKLASDLPAIVTGDLNAREDSPAVVELVGQNDAVARKLADSYREVHPKRSANEASFDDWKGTRKGSRIDFILHTSEFTAVAADIVRTSYDGHWPSDHYPVTATLRLDGKR